jgi:hypothetical protein
MPDPAETATGVYVADDVVLPLKYGPVIVHVNQQAKLKESSAPGHYK